MEDFSTLPPQLISQDLIVSLAIQIVHQTNTNFLPLQAVLKLFHLHGEESSIMQLLYFVFWFYLKGVATVSMGSYYLPSSWWNGSAGSARENIALWSASFILEMLENIVTTRHVFKSLHN